jgi:hypothetical protein
MDAAYLAQRRAAYGECCAVGSAAASKPIARRRKQPELRHSQAPRTEEAALLMYFL